MENKEVINTLSEIRNMMAKSSKVLSLSGVSSIIVGFWAILGAWIANYFILLDNISQNLKNKIFILGGIGLIIICLITVFICSKRKALKNNLPFKFDLTVKKMLWHFFLPLIIGGILCLIFINLGHYGLTSSMMLIFYGLGLVNLSGYTYSNSKYLGYTEIILGLIDCVLINYSIIFWTIGFGVGHIIYGILFYLLCERKSQK
ncbi:MAG: hypothetical protein MJ211_03040 [Bacteroidales bacterium]|nr:hypothetical protein [Bacteroidales bacterium]